MVKTIIAIYIAIIGLALAIYNFFQLLWTAQPISLEAFGKEQGIPVILIFVGFFLFFYGLMLCIISARRR